MRLCHLLLLICLNLILGCTADEDLPCVSGQNIECGPDDWAQSPYVLPYPTGRDYRVNQGNNNTCGGHQGAYRFGYDFDMPIGTIIVASRAGVVTETRSQNPDGERLTLGNENLVKILQEDGTTAAYSHLQQNGVFVAVGDSVLRGDTLGLSGNSGYTDNFPHLHFHVATCDEPTLAGCGTVLVKFRNTRANPCGLAQNEWYAAE